RGFLSCASSGTERSSKCGAWRGVPSPRPVAGGGPGRLPDPWPAADAISEARNWAAERPGQAEERESVRRCNVPTPSDTYRGAGYANERPENCCAQLTEQTGSREYKSSDQHDHERKQHKVTQEHGHTYAPSSKANLAPQGIAVGSIRDSRTTLHTRCVVISSGPSRRHPARQGAG